MQGRTFFRIMFDNLFVNNAFTKALINLVNFCNENKIFAKNELKFLKKMPLNNKQEVVYKSKFIFDANKTGVKCK